MAPKPKLPAQVYWLSLEHPCGCCIDWGVDAKEQARLPAFLRQAAPYPCPWHGSGTGEPSVVASEGTGYVVANRVWYRRATPGKALDGQRNRQAAASTPPSVPVQTATEIHEIKVAMARTAPLLNLPTIRHPSETGLVLLVTQVATRIPIERLSWIEITGHELYRLPETLHAWALDIVALVLAQGGNTQAGIFLTNVEFGILDGRAYAEFV
jgi:hypothetical protein